MEKKFYYLLINCHKSVNKQINKQLVVLSTCKCVIEHSQTKKFEQNYVNNTSKTQNIFQFLFFIKDFRFVIFKCATELK